MTTYSYNRYGKAAAYLIKQGDQSLKQKLTQQIQTFFKKRKAASLSPSHSPQPIQPTQPTMTTQQCSKQVSQVVSQMNQSSETSFAAINQQLTSCQNIVQQLQTPINNTATPITTIPVIPDVKPTPVISSQKTEPLTITPAKQEIKPKSAISSQPKVVSSTPSFTFENCVNDYNDFLLYLEKIIVQSEPQSSDFHYAYAHVEATIKLVNCEIKEEEPFKLICKINGCKKSHFPFQQYQQLLKKGEHQFLNNLLCKFYFSNEKIIAQKY